MKIGDRVRFKKVRPNEEAKIVYFEMKQLENGKIRTRYLAEFDDHTSYTFYGYDIGKKVEKVEDGLTFRQMSIDEFCKEIDNGLAQCGS